MTETVRLALADDHSSSGDDALRPQARATRGTRSRNQQCAMDTVLIVQFLSPDLILLNTNRCGGSILAVEAIAQANPDISVLLLTVSDPGDETSAECGKFRYALTAIGQLNAIETMRSVPGVVFHDASAGATDMRRELKRAGPSPDEMGTKLGLTVRETQIMNLVATGQTNGEIAAKFDIKEKTVKCYMTTIMEKLRVRNRVEAALKSITDNGDQSLRFSASNIPPITRFACGWRGPWPPSAS